MKRAKAKAERPVVGSSPSRAAEVRAPADLAVIREQITNLIANGAVEMVEATIEQVGQGHYQAMKYLFEIVGLFPHTETEDPEEDSLAGILLRHLKIPERGELAGGTGRDSSSALGAGETVP